MTPPRPELKQMTEAEYRVYPAINFSSLARFYNDGIYSPDHALMKFEFKSYFEYGKMFETMLQDAVKGTSEFEKRFFQSKVTGKMPDDMIKWIDEGENLESHIKYNKDGITRNGTSKVKHAFIDEALDNPGKIPVSTNDWELLERHTTNMLKMEYLDAKVEDILSKAQWQVPITWFDDIDGLERKALLDCVVDLGGEYLTIDIKTAASFRKFMFMLRDHYIWQDIHYVDGVNVAMGPSMQMVFFVASKEAPFLCQPWQVDYGDIEWRLNAIDEYRELCAAYHKWDQAGRFPKGWLPLQTTKYYPPK